MVDFKKLLGKEELAKAIDPTVIFGNLDKESGKEYLRPPQAAILKEWHSNFRNRRDSIVKLHTGQGKTLIGLMMLQSCINEGRGPAIYLCPNNFLVSQTVDQARSFGIETATFPESNRLPQEFLNSQAILIATCSKLFNGKSVFGVQGSGREIISVGSIVVDDAHRCLDVIRDSFTAKIHRTKSDGTNNPLYKELWKKFEDSLRRQRPGTTSEIAEGEEVLMATPFWTWHEKNQEVLELLSGYKEEAELLFVWDLIKDEIERSICIFSGSRIEISPRVVPLDLIPSFAQAQRRIFLSATLTEDAFLVRDLGIVAESVSSPLSSGDVKYSGERLILLPTLVEPSLTREKVINWTSSLAKKHGTFGVLAITPSFAQANSWEKFGAIVSNVRNLDEIIAQLKTDIKKRTATKVVVLVNEYDGVDLPDNTCRILCLDSLPSYSSLMGIYLQDVRPTSPLLKRQLAQRVEQGMGRAIRGSSDWCIVVVTGNSLTSFMSEDAKRMFLSNEAQLQIKIGEELARELKREGSQLSVIEKLVNQCLDRDQAWKEYYKERMSKIKPQVPSREDLERAVLERQAEILYKKGQTSSALAVLEDLLVKSDQTDQGWYLQLKATYLYPIDRNKSMDTQLKAYNDNQRLFRPETGIAYSKLVSKGGTQTSQVVEWIKGHGTHNALIVDAMTIMDKMSFSSSSDTFEEGLDEFGRALGFYTQRPERISGKGPDSLWRLKEKEFWVIESKNQVSQGRKKISKSEAGQLNNDIGWFEQNYNDSNAFYVIVHPAESLADDAFLAKPSWVLSQSALDKMKRNFLNFCNVFGDIPLEKVNRQLTMQRLDENHLGADDLSKNYLHRLQN